MKTKILFFATLRDKTGTRATEVELAPGATLANLKEMLIAQFPAPDAQLMQHCLAAINHEYRFDADEIPAAAEIAFFPPVSGG